MTIPIDRITPEDVRELAANEVFVFGSNERGRHSKGAALTARKKFGAINGQGDGLQGQSYGICTRDRNIQTLPLHRIDVNIARFLRFASAHPEKRFLVTAIGTGYAGLKAKDIAPMFLGLRLPRESILRIPANICLPISFWRELYALD